MSGPGQILAAVVLVEVLEKRTHNADVRQVCGITRVVNLAVDFAYQRTVAFHREGGVVAAEDSRPAADFEIEGTLVDYQFSRSLLNVY